MVDPEAYKKDPEWIRLHKSARKWRIALYLIIATNLLWTVAWILATISKGC